MIEPTLRTEPAAAAPAVQVVRMSGEFDLASADALRDEVVRAVKESAGGHVVVDMSETTFLDSTALAALIAAHKVAQESNGSVRIAAPTAAVSRLLEITQLDQVFGTHENLDDAVTAASAAHDA